MRAMLERIDAYEKLIRLDRPIGILLLLWPTLWGLWLAAGSLLIVNGGVTSDASVIGPMFDWGDGTPPEASLFPAMHRYGFGLGLPAFRDTTKS